MNKNSEHERICKILQESPLKAENQFFEIKNTKFYNNCIYNFSQNQRIYNISYFNTIVSEINQIPIENETIILFDIKSIYNFQLYIILLNSKIIIIDKSNLYHFIPFFDQLLKKAEQSNLINFYFITKDAEKEFKSEFTGFDKIHSSLFLSNEVKSFENKLIFKASKENELFLSFIKDSISSFILLHSIYLTRNYKCENIEYKKYEFDDFIFIKNIGNSTDLYLNVNDQLLYILKQFNKNISEQEQGYKHELEFYQKIGNNHPFISKYFGHFDHNEYHFIVIKYIEGETLKKTINDDKIKLKYNEKIKIIIEILLSVEYIHSKEIIIRDLKWDNIIIDSNHDAYLIDFDLSKEIENNFDQMISDIGSNLFAAPEQLKSNNYSYKADLYSIGMLINFIISEKIILGKDFLNDLKNELPNFPGNFLYMTNIYKNFLEYSPEKRLNISTVINDFLVQISNFIFGKIIDDEDNKIQKDLTFLVNVRLEYLNEIIKNYSIKPSSFIDISEIYNFIGVVYNKGKEVEKDIEKSLYYFELSDELNNPKAQCNLAIHYYNSNKPDITKVLNYLYLSINQNNAKAAFNLAEIYFEGKHVKKDINKANHYYNICGKFGDYFFFNVLGYHYYKENISRDINKAIYYYTLASRLHNPISQHALGVIYLENKYVERDFYKAFHYFKLSANQNNPPSKIFLGKFSQKKGSLLNEINRYIQQTNTSIDQINLNSLLYIASQYYKDNNKTRNINKAIEYFTMAANKNSTVAQFFLGVIYTNDESVRDINKAINYLTLASNNNDKYAQHFLGINYLKGIPANNNNNIFLLFNTCIK